MNQSLKQIHEYIDEHLEEHVERIKEFVRIPSVAAENPEGVRRCAQKLANYFEELGCKKVEIVETAGQPVVYAHYDAQARNTLLVYLMYDVKQVSGEKWTLTDDPFDPKLVELPPFKKVLVGRGTINSKGPLVAFLNALFSIKACGKELPVNLKFVAEGEEELGSAHLKDFVKHRIEELNDAQACFSPSASQNIKGEVTLSLGCKGVVEFELECSGESWGRGPTVRPIHSSMAAVVESTIWRMIHALASMTDPRDPMKVVVEGFYDNVAPPTKEDLELVEKLAQTYDEKAIAEELGVKHFYNDLKGKDLLIKMLYSTTLNIQGIQAGYTGPLFKTVLPEKIVVKIESRLVPNQTTTETVEKIRKHLNKLGYTDIKINEYPEANGVDDWSRTSPKAGIVQAVIEAYREYGFEPRVWPFSLGSSPQAIFTKDPLKLPFVSAGLSHGARAHAPDEYYVIEGNEKVKGLAHAEKFFVSLLYKLGERALR